MPFYRLIRACEVECGGFEYSLQITGDGDFTGPDVFPFVRATSATTALETLNAVLCELSDWEVSGIKLTPSDERIRCLALIAPKSGWSLVEEKLQDDQDVFTFLAKAAERRGPRLEASVEAQTPSQAIEILRCELQPQTPGLAVLIIPTDDDNVTLAACLDIEELRRRPPAEDVSF